MVAVKKGARTENERKVEKKMGDAISGVGVICVSCLSYYFKSWRIGLFFLAVQRVRPKKSSKEKKWKMRTVNDVGVIYLSQLSYYFKS